MRRTLFYSVTSILALIAAVWCFHPGGFKAAMFFAWASGLDCGFAIVAITELWAERT